MPTINIQNKSKKINKSTLGQFFFLPGTYCESHFSISISIKKHSILAYS